MTVTQKILRLPTRLTREWNFQSWKTLRQIFQILSQGFLATWSGNLFATHFNHENRVFCTMKVFFRTGFKNFSFFPRISWLFIFLSVFPSFNITAFTHKLSIFFLTSSPIFKKRYGFYFFLNVFHISCLRFLEFGVFDDMCEYDAWIWVFDAWWDCGVGFVGFVLLHSAFGSIMCYLWHTHIQWHDWDLNLMILWFSSIFLF